jgi:hypothetical protein
MAEMANDETLSTQDRFQAAKEVAKYVTPQLKAIEHLDGDGNALAPMFAMVLRGKST